MKIQQGFVTKNFWEEGKATKNHQIEVIFPRPYSARPYVMLSLERADIGQFIEQSAYKTDTNNLLHTVNRVDIAANNITPMGFNISISTWGSNIIYGYRIAWTAISEE